VLVCADAAGDVQVVRHRTVEGLGHVGVELLLVHRDADPLVGLGGVDLVGLVLGDVCVGGDDRERLLGLVLDGFGGCGQVQADVLVDGLHELLLGGHPVFGFLAQGVFAVLVHLEDLGEEACVDVLLDLLDFDQVGCPARGLVFLRDEVPVVDVVLELLGPVGHDGEEEQRHLLLLGELGHVVADLDCALHVDVGDRQLAEVYLLLGLAQREGLAIEPEAGVLNEVALGEHGVVLVLGDLDLVDALGLLGARLAGREAGHVFEYGRLLVLDPPAVHLLAHAARTHHHDQRGLVLSVSKRI